MCELTVFKVMDGEFGTDGLISSHSLFVAETADECFRHIIEVAKGDNIFLKSEAPGWWVEEHMYADTHSQIMDNSPPYPRWKMPPIPEWYKREMSSIKFPTHEEVIASIRGNRPIGNVVSVIESTATRCN